MTRSRASMFDFSAPPNGAGDALRGGGRKLTRGFTLIELLVVIAIISILAALLLPCLSKARNRARMIEEISAGRQLSMAVEFYAQDHSDAVFPGYFADARAVDDQGKPLIFPENARYPWRIVPYLSGSMDLIYSGENRIKLDQLRSRNHDSYVYAVSVFPSLGINSYFIGGNETEFQAPKANAKYGSGTVITRLNQIQRPSDLMSFMSARSAVDGNNANGYYQVTPPYLGSRRWVNDYAGATAPDEWGFVAPRFRGRAVAALMDCHAEAFDMRAVQDMRHWCNTADSPGYLLSVH